IVPIEAEGLPPVVAPAGPKKLSEPDRELDRPRAGLAHVDLPDLAPPAVGELSAKSSLVEGERTPLEVGRVVVGVERDGEIRAAPQQLRLPRPERRQRVRHGTGALVPDARGPEIEWTARVVPVLAEVRVRGGRRRGHDEESRHQENRPDPPHTRSLSARAENATPPGTPMRGRLSEATCRRSEARTRRSWRVRSAGSTGPRSLR